MVSTLSVGKLTQAEKKEKIHIYYEFHSKLLDQYGISEKDFNVKMPFFDRGTKVVGLFPNEFTKENGFYFEFIDSNIDPIDPKRRLYKMPTTPNYEHVYPLSPKGTYTVPITDLEEVNPQLINKVIEEFNFKTPNQENDENIDRLTIKDLAAILWQQPVSEKNWLNELINKSK